MSENKKEWLIFLTHLKLFVGDIISERRICFFGDRNKGSREAFVQVFGHQPLTVLNLHEIPTSAPEFACQMLGCCEVASFTFPVPPN